MLCRCGWSTCCSGCACSRMLPLPRAPRACCRTWCAPAIAAYIQPESRTVFKQLCMPIMSCCIQMKLA